MKLEQRKHFPAIFALFVFWFCGSLKGQELRPIQGKPWTDPFSGIEFVWIPPGSFFMGTNKGNDRERPRHRVSFQTGFWMSKYEITQAQWLLYMGNNPSHFQSAGPNAPVENVNWFEIQEFIFRMNQKNIHIFEYRLPTEVEWEYACRAGSKTRFYWGDRPDPSYCWLHENSNHRTHEIGKTQPNSWGLYDMIGNVAELCENLYEEYPGGKRESYIPRTDRMVRGGGWSDSGDFDQVSWRSIIGHMMKSNDVGIRVVFFADYW